MNTKRKSRILPAALLALLLVAGVALILLRWGGLAWDAVRLLIKTVVTG